MNIAVIDADLVGRSHHKFPNLVCMKLSGYHKSIGDSVALKLDYSNLDSFDKVYISKVFTDTPIDTSILSLPNVEYGGTGFFFDKATPLPPDIEHHFPDYHLYDSFVESEISRGVRASMFQYYTDYSIGFTTRGCIRQCSFCVNKNYHAARRHSPIEEFFDPTRKYICLYDDNVFAFPGWKSIFEELISIGKPFQYKGGLDERLLNDEKCEMLAKAKYKDEFIFAFDNIADRDTIIEKLNMLRKYTQRRTKFYVFCGFDRQDKWDLPFWEQDIIDMFERLRILFQYKECYPYIMRFYRYKESPFKDIYLTMASWANWPQALKTRSFIDFCRERGEDSPVMKQLNIFAEKYPTEANLYFDLKFNWSPSKRRSKKG